MLFEITGIWIHLKFYSNDKANSWFVKFESLSMENFQIGPLITFNLKTDSDCRQVQPIN